jgi:hypothetical protein
VLLQYPDNLFFGVSAALHRPSPSRNGLYLKARAISGSRSAGRSTGSRPQILMKRLSFSSA